MVAFLPRDSFSRAHRVTEALRRADLPGEEADLRKVADMVCRSLDHVDQEGDDLFLEALHVATCLHGMGRAEQALEALERPAMPAAWFMAAANLVAQGVLSAPLWRMVTCGLLECREDPGGAMNAWRLRVSPLQEDSQDLFELGTLAWAKRLAEWLSPLARASEGDLRIEMAGLRQAEREAWTRCLRQALACERARQGWRLDPHVYAG
jgi:hypothetical protein